MPGAAMAARTPTIVKVIRSSIKVSPDEVLQTNGSFLQMNGFIGVSFDATNGSNWQTKGHAFFVEPTEV
jgi:hypothetical protein